MMLSIGKDSPGSVNAPITRMTKVASAKNPKTNFHGKRAGVAMEGEWGPNWPFTGDAADIEGGPATPELLIVSS